MPINWFKMIKSKTSVSPCNRYQHICQLIKTGFLNTIQRYSYTKRIISKKLNKIKTKSIYWHSHLKLEKGQRLQNTYAKYHQYLSKPKQNIIFNKYEMQAKNLYNLHDLLNLHKIHFFFTFSCQCKLFRSLIKLP